MSNRHFPGPEPQNPEEPQIEREVESDKTGTIRRYLRLADKLLKPDGDDPKSNAA